MLIEVSLCVETEKAILVDLDGDEVWIPKSQCSWPAGKPEFREDVAELEVEDWFAQKQGWL